MEKITSNKVYDTEIFEEKSWFPGIFPKLTEWKNMQINFSSHNFSVKHIFFYLGARENERFTSSRKICVVFSYFSYTDGDIIYFPDNYCTHAPPKNRYTALNKCFLMSIFLFGFWISPKLSSFRGEDFSIFLQPAFKFICGIQNSSRLWHFEFYDSYTIVWSNFFYTM